MDDKALDWWNTLPQKERIKLADEEHWTTPELITEHQIKMIYLDKFYGY